MHWHIIEGEEGCRYAREHNCVAVIIDALRASATAAMFLHHGAESLLVVREVETALHAKQADPGALLFGERGGLPPTGFDGGNSPQDTAHASGRRVVFTTTTGAGRMVAAWGAPAVYMGTTINATAVVRAAAIHDRDVVLIPAGLTGVLDHDAQEDRVAAAYLANLSNGEVGEGKEMFEHYRARIASQGVPKLFETSPHAEKLRAIGHDEDIKWCAQVDVTDAVPTGVALNEFGVLVIKN